MFLFPTGTGTALERQPYVVYASMLAMALIQAALTLVWLLDPQLLTAALTTFGFVPARSNLWALVTGLFLHMGWLHLLGNALYLWMFGAGLENRIGHAAFAALFLTAGICSGLIHGTAVHPLGYGKPLIGASGAVAGLLGAYLVLMPFTDIRLVGCCLVWPFSTRIAAVWFLPFWFLLEFVRASWGTSGGGGDVAYWAHVGGFLIGVPIGVMVRLSERARGRAPAEGEAEPDANVAALVFRRKQDDLRSHLHVNDFAAAWALYSQLQLEFPGALLDSDCLLLLADQAVREGRFREAVDLYRSLANSNRSDQVRARAAYRMGVVCLENLADQDRASRVFQILVNRFPDTDSARGAEEYLRDIFPGR